MKNDRKASDEEVSLACVTAASVTQAKVSFEIFFESSLASFQGSLIFLSQGGGEMKDP